MATDFAVSLRRFFTDHLAGLRGCSPNSNRSPGLILGSGLKRCGNRLSVLMGGDRVGEVGVQAAVLQAAGFPDCEEPLDGAVAVVGLGSVARFPPHYGVA
jgi:hypothetical protein